ncbi:MAG: hypothetical protein HVN35_00830 [Methanobacteriaceae archaeon]|nr:hypothetical protein [Methanobacteriaceae archaeon]
MQQLPLTSQLTLYILLVLIGFFAVVIWYGQYRVLKGKGYDNPDGSRDDWHEQKTHYGIAFADLTVACPATIAGIILLLINPRLGFYIIALTSFWFLWANVMTTATSLRFEKPKITLMWFVTFPLGAIVGFAYIMWTILNFNAIFSL